MAGSSPRVRSRPQVTLENVKIMRIISACAEQTGRLNVYNNPTRDHLRVCGADTLLAVFAAAVSGSSPRVRSRRRHAQWGSGRAGIISACAEQTRWIAFDIACIRGSSPRVRSRRGVTRGENGELGIISACAEQTCRC